MTGGVQGERESAGHPAMSVSLSPESQFEKKDFHRPTALLKGGTRA
jgi:hypothetical protein